MRERVRVHAPAYSHSVVTKLLAAAHYGITVDVMLRDVVHAFRHVDPPESF